MGDRQQLLQEIARLKEQLLVKDEELLVKDEQLARKNERILYLERQLFGRRSEKSLPSYPEAQLSLFDANQGLPALEEEVSVFTTLVEEIRQKAEQRGAAKKANSLSQKRSYKLPAHIERRETVLFPKNFDAETMIKIGEDVTERLARPLAMLLVCGPVSADIVNKVIFR